MEGRVQLKAGDEVGSYRLLHEVGVGGSGLVFAVEHTVFGYRRALKIMRLHEAVRGEDAIARWRREALLLEAIQHGNIVRVHDAGVLDGCFWIVMDLLQGRTLREQIEQYGRVPVSAALHYGSQIADGVQAAHEMKVVHRDIKPENVFVTESNEIKVLDLGTAKVHGYGVKTTERYKVLGTPLYMAPEQCEGMQVTAQTDIYALGIVLYEMMAGRHPFIHPEDPHPTNQELVMRHLCAEPAPLPDVVPGLPDYIWRVVERAMRKEPTRRYASMFDFSIAMREARNKAIVAARRHGRPGAAAPLVPVARAAYGSSSPAKTPNVLPAASRQELGPRGTFKMPHLVAGPSPEPTPGVQARGQQGAETSEGSLPERGEGGERVVAVRKQATGVRPHATQRRFRLRPWHGALVGACLSLFVIGLVHSLAASSPKALSEVPERSVERAPQEAPSAPLAELPSPPNSEPESEVTQAEIDAVLKEYGGGEHPTPAASAPRPQTTARAKRYEPFGDLPGDPKAGPAATTSSRGKVLWEPGAEPTPRPAKKGSARTRVGSGL